MPDLCSSCKARIRWAVTQTGRRIPLDPDPTARGNVRLEPAAPAGVAQTAIVIPADQRARYAGQLYLSHFATCPYADQHRKPR